MYPPALSVTKETPKGGTEVDGYYVPGGTTISVCKQVHCFYAIIFLKFICRSLSSPCITWTSILKIPINLIQIVLLKTRKSKMHDIHNKTQNQCNVVCNRSRIWKGVYKLMHAQNLTMPILA